MTPEPFPVGTKVVVAVGGGDVRAGRVIAAIDDRQLGRVYVVKWWALGRRRWSVAAGHARATQGEGDPPAWLREQMAQQRAAGPLRCEP